MAKSVDQKRRDHQRKTYRLYFPAELEADHVVAWVRAISGTLRSGRGPFMGVATVAFELWATSSGIEHRIKVPWQHADYVLSQLRTLVPGIRTTPEDEHPERRWSKALEIGLTNTTGQLRIPSAPALAASLLSAVQPLEPAETVLMQWVVSPAVPTHAPIYPDARSNRITLRSLLGNNSADRDEVQDRRGKLEEANVMAVLRVAAKAESKPRADHLIYRVRAALASTRSASVRFEKRLVRQAKLQERIDEVSTPLNFPMQLAAPELAAVIAWPVGSPFVSGLPPRLSRQLPPPENVPREGRVIGRSNFPGNERPVAIAYPNARSHTVILGPTGTGKTSLAYSMIRSDLANGYGVIVLETKGDLYHRALDAVPWELTNRVLAVDIHSSRPIGFNVLDQAGDHGVAIDNQLKLFDHISGGGANIWLREVMYHGLHTLAAVPGHTLIDLAPLVSPGYDELEWRDELVRVASERDPQLRSFWQNFDNQGRARQDQIAQPVLSRIWPLNRTKLRNILGQSASGFQFSDVLSSGTSVFFNLHGSDPKGAGLMATLILDALWHAVQTTPMAKPTFLYLDEFQTMLDLPIEVGEMLAKARSHGLGLTLANQATTQLPPDVLSATMANARSKVVFQTSNEDARILAREFGRSVTEHDFMHLGRYEAIARIATEDGVSPPLTITTPPPPKPFGFAEDVVRLSEERYGRPASDVEQEIRQRRTVKKDPGRKRPDIGGPGWGKE